MANWKTTLDISDLWSKFDDGDLSVQELASKIAQRLESNEFYGDDDLVEIVYNFVSLAEDSNAEDDDFDYIMQDLYDYADVEHRIWIKTF